MTLSADRAARMGYGAPAPKAARPTTPSIRKQTEAKLYDGYDRPLSSYYDRREAGLRSDPQALQTAREERKQVEAFARARGISADHLHEALAAVHERDQFPLSQAAIETRRAQTLETLRLEHGSRENAQVHLRRYLSVTTALAKEIPSLAARANQTGAGEDPRIINALAPYGIDPQSPKE